MYLILLDGSLDRVYKPLLLKRKVSRSGGPQWGTAESEIKDPSFENPELKGSPF